MSKKERIKLFHTSYHLPPTFPPTFSGWEAYSRVAVGGSSCPLVRCTLSTIPNQERARRGGEKRSVTGCDKNHRLTLRPASTPRTPRQQSVPRRGSCGFHGFRCSGLSILPVWGQADFTSNFPLGLDRRGQNSLLRQVTGKDMYLY